jgi:hypothetical protein
MILTFVLIYGLLFMGLCNRELGKDNMEAERGIIIEKIVSDSW